MELTKTTTKDRSRHRCVFLALYYLFSIGCWLLIPAALKAQDAGTLKISVQARQKKLAEVFREIEQKSGLSIEYQHEVVDKDKLVSIDVVNETVQKILQKLLNGTDTRLVQQGKSILIVRDPKGKEPSKSIVHAKAAGTVAGRILDEENGQPVAGATLHIGNRTLASAVDGSYGVELPAGVYTATITAVGYATKELTDITVVEKRVSQLPVSMSREQGQLAGVVVRASARRESVASLYVRQKNSPFLSDGISQEQIARTPDKNLGEALRRISGIATLENKFAVVRGLSERYNSAELNGQPVPSTELNRKAFSFDLIPSTLVDAVTVVKSLTPDKSAEFGGGILQVDMRAIPDQDFTTVSIGGSYNDRTTGKTFYSLPLESRSYLGLVEKHRYLFGSLKWKSAQDVLAHAGNQSTAGMEGFTLKDPSALTNNWGPHQMKAPISPNFQLSAGRVFHLKNSDRIGAIAALTYRNTFQTQAVISARNGFDDDRTLPLKDNRYGFTANLGGLAGLSYAGKKYKITWQSLFLRTLDEQLIFGVGNTVFGPTLGYFDVATQSTFWQQQLRGEHALNKKGMRLNWIVSNIQLNRQRPDNHYMTAGFQQEELAATGEYYISAPMSILSGGAQRSWSNADERSYSWNADWQVPFHFKTGKWSWRNHFKAGLAGWHKDRSFFIVNAGTNAPSSFYPSLAALFNPARPGMGIYISRFGDGFHRKAALHALYGMFDNVIADKLRLTWGLRAEYYNINRINQLLETAKKDMGDLDFSDLEHREPNWNLFPSANITYSITRRINLRASFARSIIRPDLREMSYFNEYDYELGGTYWSNSIIQSTRIDHYDLRLEWYPGPGEVLSFSLFRKDFDYPMEIFRGHDMRMYLLKNNKSATNEGIEAEVRKSLSFLQLPVLRRITVYGNVALLKGKVTPMTTETGLKHPTDPKKVVVTEFVGPEEKRLQTGAANLMYNAGLYYDDQHLSLSVVYNKVGSRMFRPVAPYPASIYEQPLASLDAQAAVRFLKHKAEVRASVSNLLNKAGLTYINWYPGAIPGGTLDEPAAPSTSAIQYQEGKDFIDHQARPGRTFSITLTYNF